jgi:beta-lactamase regulating signal transducer with metallopeptidase domain
MRDEAAALLLAAAVASSVTVARVLLRRSALRRIFGAPVAYGAWLTVPLVVVVTLLPAASAPAGLSSSVAVYSTRLVSSSSLSPSPSSRGMLPQALGISLPRADEWFGLLG